MLPVLLRHAKGTWFPIVRRFRHTLSMFPSLTLESILEQALQVREPLEAWIRKWEAEVWHALWTQSPMWLKAVLVIAAGISVFESGVRLLRQLGLAKPTRPVRRRS